MSSDQFESLINRILDGEASETDVADLQAAVCGDANLSRLVADRFAEHRLLGVLHQPFDVESCVDAVMTAIEQEERAFANTIVERISVVENSRANEDVNRVARNADSSRQSWTKHLVGVVTGAAIALMVVATGWQFFGVSDGENVVRGAKMETPQGPARAIATVLLDEGCVWTSMLATTSPHASAEGQRLTSGRVELESGTTALRFDSGAEVIVVGPSAFELKTAASMQVEFGHVVVRASGDAEGFAVTTPTSEVVDLGTEFAVKVGRGGQTEVHVLDGEVSYRTLDASEEIARLLRAGEGVAIEAGGQARAIPMNSPRFKELLERVNPTSRADLLTAYEGFNYSPGVLPLAESTVGIGWDGPWRRRSPRERKEPGGDLSPAELEIVHGQMNVTWPVPGGRLGMLKLAPGVVIYVRPMAQAIDLGSDRVTYFSFMVREIERRTDRERPREHLRLTLRSSGDYFGDAVSFGHGPGYRPRIQAGGGELFRSPTEFSPEQTTLWVGKVVSQVEGEDEVYFRIFGEQDVLGYAEPASWHVVTRDLYSDAVLDRVLISSTGKFGRIVDELRIGPTWRSVAPMREEQ